MVEVSFHKSLVNSHSLGFDQGYFKLEPPFLVGLGPTVAPPQQLAAANSITGQDDDDGEQDPFRNFGRLHEFWQLPLLPS
jgi:hypothetical protein